MNFLYPEFLYLAPFVATPILIHLLNRVRYRRVRWAAIEFLLATERRAVRRARLRQILLMILRTFLLAAALGALAQPVFHGHLAGLLGSSARVAVLVDGSASMSAADASGSAFDRGKRLAARVVASLPRSARVTGGTFAVRYNSVFRQPIQDHAAVASMIESARMTSGAANVPQAIRDAAECLERDGGGGTIWLLSDLQAAGWQAGGAGAWEETRQALQKAGGPRIMITDLAPNVQSNRSIAKIRILPEVLIEGDTATLTAAVALQGGAGGTANVTLFFDGQRVDSRAVQFSEPGMADVVFHLPALSDSVHVGRLELEPDALPADDCFYFLVRPARNIPILVVDGMPSAVPFEGAASFLTVALRPPEGGPAARSPFLVKAISPDELSGAPLTEFAAVCLADVRRLDPEAVEALRDYVTGGGLLVIFPGAHTDIAAWNASGFPGVRIESVATAEGRERMKVRWVSPVSGVTATLPTEGLDRLAISRLFRFAPDGPGEVLAAVDDGRAFLVLLQLGKGKIYLFAVSCQPDFSNFPFTPPFLLTLHRAVLSHQVEAGEPLARPALSELRLHVPPGAHRILTPDGRVLPLAPAGGASGESVFHETGYAGIYRLVAGESVPEASESAVAVAAFNVPTEESALERVDIGQIRTLLRGFSVDLLKTGGGGEQVAEHSGTRRAASGFFFAALAIAFLVSAVLVAWSVDRPSAAVKQGGEG